MEGFTVKGKHNILKYNEIILVTPEGYTYTLGNSQKKTKRTLFEVMQENGQMICDIIAPDGSDFEFNWNAKSKSYIFNNGAIVKFK